MDKFESVKNIGRWMHPEAGFECMVYYDKDSRDWYEVRKNWRGVVAVWPDADNCVGSYCSDAREYVPVDGQTLYEVDPEIVPFGDEPMKLLGYYAFDGKEFTRTSLGVTQERTKEDIMADLMKLQEELKAM